MKPPAPLTVPSRRLMGPRPSDAHPRVLEAMAKPLVGHLDPAFVVIMDEIKAMLRALLRTENETTFVISGPGSAGMEACLVNLLEPGDEAVICSTESSAGAWPTSRSAAARRSPDDPST